MKLKVKVPGIAPDYTLTFIKTYKEKSCCLFDIY